VNDPSEMALNRRTKIDEVLARWRGSAVARQLTADQRFAAAPAQTCPLPAWLEPRLADGLRRRGIAALYDHQAASCEATRRGRDVVVATPTASGKTLCYNVPVFQELLADGQSRALYLFPTKALARDQIEEARALAAAVGVEVGVAVYDGDTPPDQRRVARRRARILATNPEMLHTGILPHHPSWAEFLGGLRYVVIDELHVYRGVFGSHLAHVLRRLQRLARFHGAAPRYLATSATIANPAELARQLIGRDVELIAQSGAPRGERHFLIYNPPAIDPALGLRESYLKSACRLTVDLAAAGVSTLVFCRSRLTMEVLLRHLRAAALRAGLAAHDVEEQIRGYRGGYLPDRRRDVERALRCGETRVVVATSALELGIDIGAIDAVVVVGWPGSRAATWQRAGRAGRRLAPSLTVLVASSDPVDQFVAADPDYLFGQAPEHARVDPDNASILVPHLKCAAFELPFARGERYGHLSAEETEDVLGCLADAGMLHRSASAFHYVGDAHPAADVSLRGLLMENFLVVEEPAGEVIAEVDDQDAPEVLHEGAIYQLEGRQFLVRRLDHDARKAYVSAAEVDYFTDAMTSTRVRILEVAEEAGVAARGEVHVLHRVLGFKKIKLHSHENIGYGTVSLPDRQMHTAALWLTLPAGEVAALGCGAAEIAEASLGAGQALHAVAALLLMLDGHDLGHAVGDARSSWFAVGGRAGGGYAEAEDGADLLGLGAPTLFLYDEYPGGTGLCERLFDLRRELLARTQRCVERCGCEGGCPGCIGPGGTAAGKALAVALLAILWRCLGDAVAAGHRLERGGREVPAVASPA
jgi:DEAD/DEAH box helicase domain-containing protein